MLLQAARTLRHWGEMIKFSHTVFALPFALSSMVVAAKPTQGWPGWRPFLLILLALVTARTCAMTFNRIVDRRFDQLNPRTMNRHLVTGKVSLRSAWALCGFSGLGFILTCWFINPTCFGLSFLALPFVCFYSLTKRFTDFTHVYLGVALGLAPLGAWLAVTGSLALAPVILSTAVVFWLIGFDIIYATQDYEFDRSQGLHSIIVRWGIKNSLQAAFISHFIMWLLLASFGLILGFRLAYFGGMVVMAICLLLEHWLARKRSLKWINFAFFRLNALISIVFFVVTTVEILFPMFRIRA